MAVPRAYRAPLALPKAVPISELLRVLQNKDVSEAARLLTAVPDPAAIRTELYGMSLLHLACRNGVLEMTRMLVQQYHCDINARDDQGQTPLHCAVKWFAPHTTRKDQEAVVTYLVRIKNCNLVSKDEDGNTPLHEACYQGNSEIVKLLLNTGQCDVTSQNKDGNTPLHRGCYIGELDIVELLLNTQQCDMTSQNKDGDTPLHVACYQGKLDIVKLLLDTQQCDVNSQNKDGDTPLHVACYQGKLDIVKLLLDTQQCDVNSLNKDGETPLNATCYNGNSDILKLLLDTQQCDVTSNKYGTTPLHAACYKGNLGLVKLLLNTQQCDLTSQNKYYGNTALHVACFNGNLDIVELLVSTQQCESGVTCHDKDGNTPLHVACYKGNLDVVKLLLNTQQCDVTSQNKDGNTPLHIACLIGWYTTVYILLSSGKANPLARNRANKFPLELTNNHSIIKLLHRFTSKIQKTSLEPIAKLFVIGNSGAGKTTLVKVIENKVTSGFFGTFAGTFRKVSGVEPLTAGINVVNIQCKQFGSVAVHDLAGQQEYYSSHDKLIENLVSTSAALFIVVVKLDEPEAEVIRTLRYWLSFVDNCVARVNATAHMIVVGSWADQTKTDQSLLEKWSCNIERSSLVLLQGVVCMDCRKLACTGLDTLCDLIKTSFTALRQVVETNQKSFLPHLLYDFLKTTFSDHVGCTVAQIISVLHESDQLLPKDPQSLCQLISELNDGGHLLYLPNTHTLEDGWVIMDKQALLSDINGTIFSPENFKQYHDIATSTGVVRKSNIENVFPHFDSDMIVRVLTQFEFCQEIKDDSTLSLIDPTVKPPNTQTSETYYFFPALVRVERPEDIWQGSPSHYRCGWSLQCSKEGQYFTSMFLHVLLLRLAFSFPLKQDNSQRDEASPVLVAPSHCAIWKNGIQWLRNGIETIVEVVEHTQTVILLLSCLKGKELGCVRHRTALIRTISKVKEDICPSVLSTELLIDPTNMSTYPLCSTRELTVYKISDAAKTIQERGDCVEDRSGKKSIQLENALYFEPYVGLSQPVLNTLFNKRGTREKVDDVFLEKLARYLNHRREERQLQQRSPQPEAGEIDMFLRMLQVEATLIPSHGRSYTEEYLHRLVTWRDSDPGGGTYESLCSTLNTCSVFKVEDVVR